MMIIDSGDELEFCEYLQNVNKDLLTIQKSITDMGM